MAAAWETRVSTFSLLESQLLQRKEYAINYKLTGNKNLLQGIDICNNNIKDLLGL